VDRKGRGREAVLTSFIEAAMRHAEYEQLADGSWFGRISELEGVWSNEISRESCEVELQSTLEDWFVFRLTNRFPIPPIDGIELTAAKVA
jgi:predicted RNase H-like HicB family nuclease